jgi:hypothetical protein
MRWLLGSIAALGWVVLGVACNTVDPSECWPNTSGGFGGGGTIPIGSVGASSGDFPSPPPGPLDYGGGPNPCIEKQDPCNQHCEDDYNSAALACAKIEDSAQRKACQDAAFAAYMGCRDNCSHSSNDCKEKCKQQCDKEHDACHADCTKNDPTSSCHAKCNDKYGKCLKECDKKC